MRNNRNNLLRAIAISLPSSLAITAFLWALPALAKNPPFPAEETKSWITFGLGISGAAFGALSWWRGAVVKQYAAERDFSHLRRNQEMISQAVAQIGEEIEALNRDIDQSIELDKEIKQQIELLKIQAGDAKGNLTAIWHQVQAIAAKIDSSTAGWTKTELK